jgi:hypothetical protein
MWANHPIEFCIKYFLHLVWPFHFCDCTFPFFSVAFHNLYLLFFIQVSVLSKSSSASQLVSCSFALNATKFGAVRLLCSVYRGWIMRLSLPFWRTQYRISYVSCLDALVYIYIDFLFHELDIWSERISVLDIWVLVSCFRTYLAL